MRVPFYLKLAAILTSIVLSTVILIYAKEFLLPIVISALLAFMLYPIVRKLKSFKIPAILAIIMALLMILLVFLIVVVFITSQVSGLVSELSDINQKLALKIEDLHVYLVNTFQISNSTFDSWLASAKGKLLEQSGSVLSGTFSATTNLMGYLALIPVYVFCFLLYFKSFKDFAFTLIKGERHREISGILIGVQKLTVDYLKGLFSVIIIVGILNSIGLWILGINNALFFGFFASLLTIIPYIGIFIGSLLPIAYALLTKDSMLPAFGVVLVFSLVQLLESNFITPKVVGSKVSINPFAAIVALLVGAQIWGAAGMILSIPVTAILKLVFDSLESTKAIGYFLGSELTDEHDHPAQTLKKEETE